MKGSAGRGAFSSGHAWRPFNSIDELAALIADAMPHQMRVDDNGREVRAVSADLLDGRW